MKNSDFTKILESFPGREELKRCKCKNYKTLCSRYAYLDFEKIGKSIARGKTNLPKNEEKWIKFISFFAIAAEFEAEMPSTEKILTEKSQQIAQWITEKFNKKNFGSKNVIQEVGRITLEELITFEQDGEKLF